MATSREQALERENVALRAALQELADRGIPADMNPTRRVYWNNPGWEQADGWWVSYLRRCDEAVRAKANSAIRRADATGRAIG